MNDAAGPFASSWRRRHLTVDERVARGLAVRQEAPRSSHGRWKPAPDRPDPVTLLEQQAASRVPDLVPIRHGRMLASPFTFYRGAALIMAADLAATPVSGVTVQLCGDAHLSNFGLFGTPERQMLFDINDFDETLPGPWEWDVKRLAASFEIMGRDRGFSPDVRRTVVMAGVREYRSRMRRAAGMGSLDAWYEHFEVGMLLKLVRREVGVKRVGKGEARAIEEMAAKARTRDSTRVFARRAEEVEGELRIVADPPVIIPIEDIIRIWPVFRDGNEPLSGGHEDALAQQREAGPAVHLALDHLDPVDVALDGARVPGQGQAVADSVVIALV